MATGMAAKYIAPMRQYIDVRQFTAFRSFLLGAGFAYAISEDKYHHLPVTFLIPSVYAGYQTYKNRDVIATFVREKLK